MLQDFVLAEADCSKAIAMNSTIWAPYFLRASVLDKMQQLQSAETGEGAQMNVTGGYISQQILNDLTRVVEINPNMEYAYYNRCTIYAKANDYHSAVADLTKAIEINDKLAEAYYNRALVYVFQNKIDDAIKDLSRAGELGLYQAYNIIKRFSYTD
jgi:tetratricopeptide (TPR) repeat protein